MFKFALRCAPNEESELCNGSDLQKFFDSLNHGWLIQFVEHRVADKRVVRLIKKWLNAGIMEKGKWHCVNKERFKVA